MVRLILLIILACCILIDWFYVGFFFRYSDKFDGFRKDEKIIYQSKWSTGFTFLKKKGLLKKVFENYYGGVLTIILTNQRLLFKPQLRTCALSVEHECLYKITEEKYLFKQYLCVHYYKGLDEKKFYFCPKKEYDEWLKILRKVISETRKKENTVVRP